MRDLLLRRNAGDIPTFDRLIIETTGIAFPGPIIRTLLSDPVIATHYSFAGTVTTVDAVNGSATLARNLESQRQVALADQIVITKEDITGNTNSVDLVAEIRSYNSAAPIRSSSLLADSCSIAIALSRAVKVTDECGRDGRMAVR